MPMPCCCGGTFTACDNCSTGQTCGKLSISFDGITAGTIPVDFVPDPGGALPSGTIADLVTWLNATPLTPEACPVDSPPFFPRINLCVWDVLWCLHDNLIGRICNQSFIGCTQTIGKSDLLAAVEVYLYTPGEVVSLGGSPGCTAYSFTVPAGKYSMVLVLNISYSMGVFPVTHNYYAIFRHDFNAKPDCTSFAGVVPAFVAQTECFAGLAEAVMIDASAATATISCGMSRPASGPGTAISKALSAIGVKPCGGCKKRAAWLDRAWAKVKEFFQ